MRPYKVWHQNVRSRPETFKMGEHNWKDTDTGWKMWVANGFWFYCLVSPEGGNVPIGFTEKFRVKLLINWWASGALNVAKQPLT